MDRNTLRRVAAIGALTFAGAASASITFFDDDNFRDSDVSDVFRGVEHRVQMQNPPAATTTVNAQGEPRA